ncbi:hypothetical protein [Pacificoceanicola onchidii]|uniref:hypothetical protein n=1 Tax=Pacificoceanicola onchidii TaxID=2562685 RepID=UPI0010A6B08B|nr:hypothetical protein [Pacificoceanicola onchidii]
MTTAASPPDWFKSILLGGPATAGRCSITITAHYMPPEAAIAVSFAGPGAQGTVDFGPALLSETHDSFGWILDLPAHFETELEVSLWRNGQDLAPDADVTAAISVLQDPE